MKITTIDAREILDSRGSPTVEVDIALEDGFIARASCPSGASVGGKEVKELRDGSQRFAGKGVLRAIETIKTEVAPQLLSRAAADHLELDALLIGYTNVTTPVSLALFKAAAHARNLAPHAMLSRNYAPPIPLINIINGGMHADNQLDVQEVMIAPRKAKSVRERIRVGCEVFYALKQVLKRQNLSTAVGDEGGFAPQISSCTEAMDLIVMAIKESGHAGEVDLALDVAASNLCKDGLYYLPGEGLNACTSAELIERYKLWMRKYPIISIEDGLDENDLVGWEEFTQACGSQAQLVGDDLFVTQTELLAHGIQHNMANAVLLKPNQCGTLARTMQCAELAKTHNYARVMSHRSGETEDPIIAHIAIGLGCEMVKFGSVCRSDRTAKYNELMRIEEVVV